MSLSKRIGIFSVVVIITSALDQLSKIWARLHFADGHRDEYFGGLFEMFLTHNSGAMLGLGGEMSDTLRFMIFIVGISIFLMVATWYGLTRFHSWLETACLACLVSGGANNVYDRIMQDGLVTDFLFMNFGFIAHCSKNFKFSLSQIP